MMTKENVITLIVKGDGAFTPELGLVVKQACQHSSHSMTQSSGEIVEDDFRPMGSNGAVIFSDVFGDFDVGHFEVGSRPVRKVCDQETVGRSVVLINDKDVGVLIFDGLFDHFFY